MEWWFTAVLCIVILVAALFIIKKVVSDKNGKIPEVDKKSTENKITNYDQNCKNNSVLKELNKVVSEVDRLKSYEEYNRIFSMAAETYSTILCINEKFKGKLFVDEMKKIILVSDIPMLTEEGFSVESNDINTKTDNYENENEINLVSELEYYKDLYTKYRINEVYKNIITETGKDLYNLISSVKKKIYDGELLRRYSSNISKVFSSNGCNILFFESAKDTELYDKFTINNTEGIDLPCVYWTNDHNEKILLNGCNGRITIDKGCEQL